MRATHTKDQKAYRWPAWHVLMLALLVAACGEYDDTLDPIERRGVGGGSSRAVSIHVVADRHEIATGGEDIATVTARVTDAFGDPVAREPVEFRSIGGSLAPSAAATDAQGEVRATLTTGDDVRNRQIVVAAAAGRRTGELALKAHGSTLAVEGPSVVTLGDEAVLTVSLTTGEGHPLANESLRFMSQVGNTVQPEFAITDRAGQVAVHVSTHYGDDTIGVVALDDTVVGHHRIEVVDERLSFADDAVIEMPVGRTHRVPVTWESQRQAVRHQPVRFSATAGEIVGKDEIVTNGTGVAVLRLRSDQVGPATLTAEPAATGYPAARTDIEFIATEPAALELDVAAPRVQTSDTSEIVARLVDGVGRPVKGAVVRFTGHELMGGSIDGDSAVTNSVGEARMIFTAGAQPSGDDAIEIGAAIAGIVDSVRLTVVPRRLHVALAASHRLREQAENTQYAMPFEVQVSDRHGGPIERASIELEAYPLEFVKGALQPVDSDGLTYDEALDRQAWEASRWAARIATRCEAEDLNRNGRLDASEDRNGNARLDPESPVVLVPRVSPDDHGAAFGVTLDTDVNGKGRFDMVYPASHAGWARVRVVARARAFDVESTARFDTTLPMLDDELAVSSGAPVNASSPYGLGDHCSDTQ